MGLHLHPLKLTVGPFCRFSAGFFRGSKAQWLISIAAAAAAIYRSHLKVGFLVSCWSSASNLE